MRGLLGLGRQPPPLPLFPAGKRASPAATLLFRLRRLLPSSRLFRLLLLLAALSLVPPAFFHFRLRRFNRVRPHTRPSFEISSPFEIFYRRRVDSNDLLPLQMRERSCGWIPSPPLVCAHGGDSTNAFPNSMDAFRMALDARVDCVEVDVSRSSDGTLLALHDR
ncbi:unnamed protein product [Triticum turgidum subsp. durum]|uniref:glycerophosphodiester phosphodiesterase n=1 Tax=Triticum turgidum subsp. durum TaxID=4567 RepID=A0A9R0W1D7_TRITD|nr:unnamed protein product [Triticum turgidum subsp. durum]